MSGPAGISGFERRLHPAYTGSWAFIIKVSEEEALEHCYIDDRTTKLFIREH